MSLLCDKHQEWILKQLLLLVCWVGLVYANADIGELDSQNLSLQLPATARSVVLMDGPVNPETYMVGPGDVFALSFVTNVVSYFQLIVSPLGDLLVPGVGIVGLKGLFLPEALDLIKRTCESGLPLAKIDVTLDQVRSFKVYLHPAASTPQVLIANPTSRVLDAYLQLLEIENLTEPLPPADELLVEPEEDPFEIEFPYFSNTGPLEHSCRNITIFRNGETIPVDLLDYQINKTSDANPFLLEGDIIDIPLLRESVMITGGVMSPGYFEFVEGETVGEVLNLAGGLTADADSSQLYLHSFIDDTKDHINSLNFNQDGLSHILSPSDMIRIPVKSTFRDRQLIMIEGEVRFPGLYSIIPGRTTVLDILKLAGGYTALADSGKLTITTHEEDIELNRLVLLPYDGITDSEQSYLRSRQKIAGGFFHADTPAELQEGLCYLLRSEDIIIIPRQHNYIEVIGAVANPGRYLFEEQNSAKDYIRLAGGMGKNATHRIYVYKPETGARCRLSEVEVLVPGDVLFVEERAEYVIWRRLQETIGLISTVATTAVIILSLSR
jgi:protein involved in polysaccharide export with SLBB domain